MQWGYVTVAPCGRAKGRIGRCATKSTGASVDIGTMQGVVSVTIYHDMATGKDMFRVDLHEHGGKKGAMAGKYVKALAFGPLDRKGKKNVKNTGRKGTKRGKLHLRTAEETIADDTDFLLHTIAGR